MKIRIPRTSRKLLLEGFFCLIFSGLVLALVTLIGLNFDFFNPFKNAFEDFSYLDMYYAEKLDDNADRIVEDIVLVNIDRLDRSEIATLIDKLKLQQPAVLGLDIIFKQLKDPIGDQALRKSLIGENIVSTYALTNEGFDRSSEAILDSNAPPRVYQFYV